jgi:protein disulfide-isomerase A6
MKPDWDKLSATFADSSSVVVADVDCTTDGGKEVCNDAGVKGYPTIKYFTAETGAEGEAYNGARSLAALETFVKDKLEVSCDITKPEECDEKEQGYITKMSAKDKDAIAAEVTRLSGMMGAKMSTDKKQWMAKRLAIIKQM